jgi:uncharacterized protein YndB with AHSA1/START domain
MSRTDYSVSVEIAAPPERVWSVMVDGARWPEWTASVTSVTRLDGGPLRIGSRARIHQPRVPPAEWRVTELDEGRSFTWVTGSALARATARHQVEPIPSGTRATLAIRYSGLLGGLVGRLTRALNDRYLALEAAGLKARSEGRV